MERRLVILKTILWVFVGALAAVTVARFLTGLGTTTDLSDAAPWGLWIAFDVMGGVALAAGGFVIAATVYIFGREKYRPFARPAILTAFLGYAAVAVGLIYDLGRPWNIWHPMIFWQHHSVLFEVAMCVMLYLTVLALEFAPTVLEHPLFSHPIFRFAYRLLKSLTIPLVIAGIVLSTLHQSSLGSLFLIAPYRLHPLWYSPIVYVLFLVSAIALGLMVVTAESLLGAYFFRHKIRVELLSGLGRATSFVLLLYLALRLGDLAYRGVFGHAFDASWQTSLFIVELALSAIVPAALLSIRRVRTSVAGLAVCAAMVIAGFVMYRFDVCIVAFARPEGTSYFPAWTEFAVSIGIVSAAALVFIFFVEHLKVYSHDAERATPPAAPAGTPAPRDPIYDPATLFGLAPYRLAAPRRYSLMFVVGAAVAAGLLPHEALFGAQLVSTPVAPARMRTQPASDGGVAERVLVIDGNRDGRAVVFNHERHVAASGEGASCVLCHHANMPRDENSQCAECHRDMYESTDIFDHARHATHFGGNVGCAECHVDPTTVKSRATAIACAHCHADMLVEDSRILAPADGLTGLAPGYKEAMHGLCKHCHGYEDRTAELPGHAFPECVICHGGAEGAAVHE